MGAGWDNGYFGRGFAGYVVLVRRFRFVLQVGRLRIEWVTSNCFQHIAPNFLSTLCSRLIVIFQHRGLNEYSQGVLAWPTKKASNVYSTPSLPSSSSIASRTTFSVAFSGHATLPNFHSTQASAIAPSSARSNPIDMLMSSGQLSTQKNIVARHVARNVRCVPKDDSYDLIRDLIAFTAGLLGPSCRKNDNMVISAPSTENVTFDGGMDTQLKSKCTGLKAAAPTCAEICPILGWAFG